MTEVELYNELQNVEGCLKIADSQITEIRKKKDKIMNDFLSLLPFQEEGRVIECRTKPSAVKGTDVPNDWTEMKELEYWNNIEYRIKQQSEAKFRPFNTEEECWQEIRKHEPFIKYKVIESSKDVYLIIQRIKTDGIETDVERLDFETAFEWFTFADGVPFGVKVEE